jgi:hypothetical protein
MANGDDGFSEVGGGGSVAWKVDVNDGNLVKTTPKPPGKRSPWGYIVEDSDDVRQKPLDDKYFHIQILQPANGATFGYRYNPETRAFDIYLPIRNRRPAPGMPRQIRVMWAVREGDVPVDALHPLTTEPVQAVEAKGKALTKRTRRRPNKR